MHRAGISGTNWTGKSTTIRQFVGQEASLAIDVITLSDFVAKCPHPMIQHQTPEASRWMVGQLQAVLGREPEGDLQLFDRTPVDVLAFTHYAFDRNGTGVDDELIDSIRDLLADFGSVYYTPVGEEWPVGVSPPPKDVAFALLIDRYIQQVSRRYGVRLVELPWSLPDRIGVLEEGILGQGKR